MLNKYNTMSASLAAAKKRRAPVQTTPSPNQPSANQDASTHPNPPVGLTLPQVIQVVDRRLFMLENTVKEMVSTRETVHTTPDVPSNITEVLDEFNARFEHMASEIENLKNIVLSLQTYTMDVNKMLLEDRIQLISGNKAHTPLEHELGNSL